jgi:amidase
VIDDRFGALVPGGDVTVAGAEGGALAGRTFVAKDVFDVAGMRTGAGNPTLRATTAPAAVSAVAVQRLLAAGATLVGRSRTDELAYGLSGRNELDGAPTNPAAPGHLTGGSSSGSAAAVAGGLAAIGLGTDTGGSIRVPASHCGLFGLRPTHGRVPVAGLVPLAPSFDTVGWLTATADLLGAVGPVLLDEWAPQAPPSRLVVLDDVAAVANASIEEAVEAIGLPVDHVRLGRHGELDRWREAFRALQGAEAWATHGDWITSTNPDLDPAVRARFEAASRVTADEVSAATIERARLRARLDDLLDDDVALAVPAAAGPPLAIDADAATIDASRQATLTITVIASLAGLPATASPVAGDALPMGVSLIGRAGTDESLLALLAKP